MRSRKTTAPCRTRTYDLLVRSQALYPAELRAHIVRSYSDMAGGSSDATLHPEFLSVTLRRHPLSVPYLVPQSVVAFRFSIIRIAVRSRLLLCVLLILRRRLHGTLIV